MNASGASKREPQLAYSELQGKTHDERKRRQKAAKIAAVIKHFLGREDLESLTVLDLGCSTGYTVDTLRDSGCRVIGLDIDVPGLVHARNKFAGRGSFVCADGGRLPFGDSSIDVVVFNHIYEHVVDPDLVLSEIRRVLRTDGIAYFGFGNKRGVIEPHYRLPFLSWLPRRLADRYVSRFGRADRYYEQFRTRRELLAMCAPLNLWDYTYTVLSEPIAFHATDMVPARLARLPVLLWRAVAPIMPTFVWIGTLGHERPAGPPVRSSPRLLRSVTPPA